MILGFLMLLPGAVLAAWVIRRFKADLEQERYFHSKLLGLR